MINRIHALESNYKQNIPDRIGSEVILFPMMTANIILGCRTLDRYVITVMDANGLGKSDAC